ncbi:MAG: metal-dependent hydrolase [Pseudobdellovibrionaceae bacterium]
MATIMTHGIVGYTIARICVRQPVSPWFWGLAVLAPMLPDLDVLGMKYYGIEYKNCFGHRGAFHSLFAAFIGAMILLMVLKGFTRIQGWRLNKDCFLGLFLGISSHPLLDALTNGGLGVAVFWPLSCRRYFFPIRPIEVSPLTLSRFFEQGIFIMKNEFYYVWIPCFLILLFIFLFDSSSQRMRMD